MGYFYDVIKGIASDMAYYEVLKGAEKYLKKPNKQFEEYLAFILGIEKFDFIKIKKLYNKNIKEIKKYEGI